MLLRLTNGCAGWFTVCRCNGVPKGRIDNELVDVAHALFNLGIYFVVVPVHGALQVGACLNFVFDVSSHFDYLTVSSVTCSNVWPTIPVAAVFVGMDQIVFSSPVFWMGLFIIPVATILVDIVVKV